MEQRQSVLRQLAFYVTSIAFAVSAVRLVRTLSQVRSAGSSSSSNAISSPKSEAIVSDSHQGNGKGILVAALVGAAIGAGVTLFRAPRSGKKSRDWLARRTRELEDRVGVDFVPSPDVISDGVIPS